MLARQMIILETFLETFMKRQLLLSWLTPLALLGLPSAAWGHAIETNYAFDLFNSELAFTSTFSTGEGVAGADYKVYAPNNPEQPWLEGVLDEAGNFSFLPDTSIAGDWKIHIKKEGHEDIWIVPVENDRIEFDQISQEMAGDIHYAQTLPAPWHLGLVAGGLGLGLWHYRKQLKA
jgi:nickel transport protein